MAVVSASTKRGGGVTGGLENAYSEEIASLECLPLDPVDPNVSLGIEGLGWHELLQTAVDAGLDIVEGDLLVVGSTEYPIRAVADWTWKGSDYRVLYLEDKK